MMHFFHLKKQLDKIIEFLVFLFFVVGLSDCSVLTMQYCVIKNPRRDPIRIIECVKMYLRIKISHKQ